MNRLLNLGILFILITACSCMQTEKKWERIETNLELIYGNQGVPVKFCYNETSVSKGVTSVPGCPKSNDGIPWIYYGNPPRCYLAGHYGPCPVGEKLLAVRGSPFGICACECFVDDIQVGLINWKSNEKSSTSKRQRYYFCLRQKNDGGNLGQVYDTETKRCHPIYSQGPCEKGKVITLLDFETQLPVCKEPTQDMRPDVEPYSLLGCGGGGGSPVTSVSSIQNNRYKQDERYSENLRKCVKQQEFIVP